MGAKKWMVGGAALLLAAACALTPSFARQENGQYIAAAVTTGSSTQEFSWAEKELVDPTPGPDEGVIVLASLGEEEEDTLTATLTVSPPELPLLGASSELAYTVTLEPPSSGGETAEGLTLTAQVCDAEGTECTDVTCTVTADTKEENTWTVTLPACANAEDEDEDEDKDKDEDPPAAGLYTLKISLSCTNGVFNTVVLDQVFYVNHQTDLSGAITGTSISLTSDAET
ncbi:MAG: hypothetical protein LUD69_08350 [Oscillospiraceae bacterium]|nr:hypothetical protein [Oscillospiraceae bacterium]